MKKELLEYYCAAIREMFTVPMMLFDKESGQMDLIYLVGEEDASPFLYDSSISSFYSGKNLFDVNKMVSYYISDDGIAFGCISDEDSGYCVYVGPCLLEDLTEKLLHSMMSRSNSPFLASKDRYSGALRRYLSSLPRLSQERFLMLLQFSNTRINRCVLQEKDFSVSSLSKRRIRFSDQKKEPEADTGKVFVKQRVKKDLLALIRSGDSEKVKSYWLQIASENPLLSHDEDSAIDPLRQCKDSFISFLSFLISGIQDLLPGDRQLIEFEQQQTAVIENIISFQQADYAYRGMMEALCRLLDTKKDAPVSQNRILKNAMAYISDHIYENISSQDIADALSISRGRLSNLFNQEFHLSIPETIRKEKIETAKLLLETTDLRIIEISNLLSFSSQSYFQNIFKKQCGITPKKYRSSLER